MLPEEQVKDIRRTVVLHREVFSLVRVMLAADNMVMFLAMGGVILLAGAGALAYNMMSGGG